MRNTKKKTVPGPAGANDTLNFPFPYCVIYHPKTKEILDFYPKTTPFSVQQSILTFWSQPIPQEILLALSGEQELTLSELKRRIGHSPSTLHDIVSKLEQAKLIKTEMRYEGKKQKLLFPCVFFITDTPPTKKKLKKLFQGLWIDTEKTKQVIAFLEKKPDRYFSLQEISAGTGIPLTEVEILLSNLESPITRTLSDFLKEPPFEKYTFYKAKIRKKKKR
ncbi:MarR family transcriptional regulator [Candidatus Woesearchaeota archaeon]|nr:MAG: MarR family transcriptional regulator [Candidatus Woesearchaeota archaeon]